MIARGQGGLPGSPVVCQYLTVGSETEVRAQSRSAQRLFFNAARKEPHLLQREHHGQFRSCHVALGRLRFHMNRQPPSVRVQLADVADPLTCGLWPDSMKRGRRLTRVRCPVPRRRELPARRGQLQVRQATFGRSMYRLASGT